MTGRPIVILGAGGHGKVVAATLLAAGFTIRGFIDKNLGATAPFGLPLLGDDAALARLDPRAVQLANGIGSIGAITVRQRVFEAAKKLDFEFVTLSHPAAHVAPSARLGEGAQIMAGAIVQADSVIGADVIVNTGALIDHDCSIGAHTHVAPGATISGSVVLGEGCHVGTGACLIQGVELGAGCIVGAGAVVVRSFGAGSKLLGVPAKDER